MMRVGRRAPGRATAVDYLIAVAGAGVAIMIGIIAWNGSNSGPDFSTCADRQGAERQTCESLQSDQWSKTIDLQVKIATGCLAAAAGWVALRGHIIKRQDAERADQDAKRADRQQLLDRYNAAIGQLGHDSVDVRLGGLFTLEALIRDYPEEYARIGYEGYSQHTAKSRRSLVKELVTRGEPLGAGARLSRDAETD